MLPLSLPACLSVRPCAVFNMLRGHMSTPNATEQIRYFVCVHSSFGPIHVLAFCYCHAWWVFLRCPPRGRDTFQGLSAEAHVHTRFFSISFRLTFFYGVAQANVSENSYCGMACNLWGGEGNFQDKEAKVTQGNHLGSWRFSWWKNGIKVHCFICCPITTPTSWPFWGGGHTHTHTHTLDTN